MRSTHFRIIMLMLLFTAVFSGCSKRYWYRIKMYNGSTTKQSVKVTLVNHTPKLLPEDFEKELKKGTLKELKKQGFSESSNDSPQFEFVLNIAVDSFNTGLFQPSPRNATYTTSRKPANSYPFKRTVRAILFQCYLHVYKTRVRIWEKYDDIYYFDDYRRDVGRSEGMVRYLIRTACEDQAK